MRNVLPEYYSPTDPQYELLWREATIVFDTNVLLDLYRLPSKSRNEFMSVIELLSDRIWVPFQVALEYQLNRIHVIASSNKAVDDMISSSELALTNISNKITSFQIDKQEIKTDWSSLNEGIDKAKDHLITILREVKSVQNQISHKDSIRDGIDRLFADKVGPAPVDQAELDSLIADGNYRYDKKIPPGFADSDKDKNQNEAIVIHNGIEYQRKFGDLIVWKQILAFARSEQRSRIIFVTSDSKPDWWWTHSGRTLGPRPELCKEISEKGGVELFWMYTPAQFLENAKRFAQASVSDESLTDLKEIPRHRKAESNSSHLAFTSIGELPHLASRRGNATSTAVRNWLETEYGEVYEGAGFPDYYTNFEDKFYGYEVKNVRSVSKMLLPPGVINSMMRGYLETNEGRLDRFTMILVADVEDISAVIRNGIEITRDRLRRLLNRYPIYEIFVGFTEGNSFFPVIHMNGDDGYSAEDRYVASDND